MSTYHAFELAITGLAVAGSGAFVLRGWWAKLRGRAAKAAATGCSSCNDCGACGSSTPPGEAPVRFVRGAAR